MAKTNNAQWIHVSILSSCIVMLYVTCTVGEYDILPAKPEPDMATPPVAPARPCTPGESRQFYPSDGGLSYSDKSACKPGTMFCEKSDMGGTIWMESAPVSAPVIGKNDESCNGIDDDCDGQIDEEYKGVNCSARGSYNCQAAGLFQCQSGRSVCIVENRVAETRDVYYAIPHVIYAASIEQDWDWDCNMQIDALFCTYSEQIIVYQKSSCSFSTNMLNPPPPSYDRYCNFSTMPLCINGQYATLSDEIIGKGVPAMNCGKRVRVMNCSWNGVKCIPSNQSDYVVACK